MCLTTICVRSGQPGYCDTDYEYLRPPQRGYTAEFPTEEEFVQFVNESCKHYTHVCRIKAHMVKLPSSTSDAAIEEAS